MKQRKIDYENVVYICHPYKGSQNNFDKVSELMKDLTDKYPNFLFVSGITSFGYAYHSVNYDDGLDMCLWLLDKCDEMWVFGDYESSTGCNAEIEFCKERLIPIFYGG